MKDIKDSSKVTYRYYEYLNTLYFESHLLSDKDFKNLILDKIIFINKQGNYHFSYGIFNPILSISELKEISKNLNITICEVNGVPVACCYQYKFDNEVNSQKILHVGLLLSANNPGRDVTFCLRQGVSLFYQKQAQEILLTNISADPYFIGTFGRNTEFAWPAPFSNNQRPAYKFYNDVATTCFNEYIKKFFPFPENLSIDLKRFVIKSKAIEMGFETNMRNMVRDPDLQVNLFSMFWLDYSQQEILLQVGIFNEKSDSRIAEQREIEIINIE